MEWAYNGINITVSNVTIQNITVANCTAAGAGIGIYVYNSSNPSDVLENITLYSVTVNNSGGSIVFDNVTDCNVSYCTIKNSSFAGIVFSFKEWGWSVESHCDNCTVSHCSIYQSIHLQSGPGIHLENSTNCTISDNTIYNMSYNHSGPCAYGIDLFSSDYNNIFNNNISYCESGGTNLFFSDYNNITSNHVFNNTGDSGYGISLFYFASNNTIISNYVYNNSYGIYINSSVGALYGPSENNTITKNNVYNNPYGIHLNGSNNNIIYNNNFSNSNNVRDNGNNTWNITKTLGTNIVGRPYIGGNYWSDYNGEDTDGDGIGDTNLPYNGTTSIDNGGDYLPLVVSSPPTQTGENPSNGSSGISLTPVLNITVDDVDDGSLAASWYSNSSGSWALFATNTSIDTSSGSVNIVQTNSNFSSNSTTCWWSVNLTDGTHWTNATYHFTTIYIPNPPSSFTAATFNRTQIDLSWTKGDKADKTYIEWNSIESWARGSGTPLYNGTGTSYQHTDLSFGATYYYRAWSWNNTDNCWSTTNSSDNATTNSNSVPVQSSENPTNNTGNIDITQSTVNVPIIDPDGDSFNWTIQGPYVTNTGQNGESDGSKSANLITPLLFDTNIIWYVNVTDGHNRTNATYNFTVRSQYIPNPPSGFTAIKYNRTRIDLSWTNAGNNKTYIERNTTESWARGSGTFIYNGTGTSHQNTSLNGNTQYFYQAWSWNETDNVYSTTNVSDNATTSNTVPSLNGEAPANGSTDQQRWPACNITVTDVDADTMNISFYENTTGNWVLQQTNTSVASGTSVLWSNFTNASSFSTVYNWSVNVTDGHGGWTNETYNFTTLNQYVPDQPASFSATASSSSQIDLSWAKGSKADRTRIQRKTGDYPTSISDGTNVSNSTGNSKSDTGLSSSTTYYYRAWSWNDTGNCWSIFNSSTSATTKSSGRGPGLGPGDTTPPTTPANVICTTPETDNTPSFSWGVSTDTSGISGYYAKIDNGTDTWIGNVLIWTSATAVEDGSHTFYVKAKDASSNGNIGSYGSCSFTVNTTAVGDSPVAAPNGPYTGLTFQSISFDGSNSHDADGTITNYTWDFGDGTAGYNINPTHIYNLSGTYNITLTVTDNDGLTNSDTTTATILLDSDGDGWSDDMENSYGTNATDPTDQITDTDGDGIPDDDSPDGKYTGDPDDDNDGLDDVMEDQLGSDPKNKSDVKNIDDAIEGGYLVDTNGDGTYDKFYNSTSKINTAIEVISDGKYNVDTDGDGKWNYIYDPASGTATPYEEKPPEEFPWIPVIAIIIVVIIVIIFLLFKRGYIFIEEKNKK